MCKTWSRRQIHQMLNNRLSLKVEVEKVDQELVKGDENPYSQKSKGVEDSSTKVDNKGGEHEKDKRGSGGDKGKGKQALTSDEDFYYQGE